MYFRQRLLFAVVTAGVAFGCGPSRPVVTNTDAGVTFDAGVSTNAYFSLRTDPAMVTIGQGGVATVNVIVTRTRESGTISFSITGLPTGMTATFAPASTTADVTTMTLTTTSATPLGTVMLNVSGTGSGSMSTSTLQLSVAVTVPVDILLVDDDRSSNNSNETDAMASASDNLFHNLLTQVALPYNTYVVPSDSSGPSFEQLKSYKTVIWYCGSNYGGEGNLNTVSGADEAVLKAFLDLGGRKVSIFASSYLYGQSSANTWQLAEGEWLRNYIGAKGIAWDRLNDNTYTVNGVGLLLGTTMAVANGTPLRTFTDPINPAAGTDTFFTALMDPDPDTAVNTFVQASIAVGRRNVGTLHTSRVTLFSFPFENLTELMTPNRKLDVFTKVLAY